MLFVNLIRLFRLLSEVHLISNFLFTFCSNQFQILLLLRCASASEVDTLYSCIDIDRLDRTGFF